MALQKPMNIFGQNKTRVEEIAQLAESFRNKLNFNVDGSEYANVSCMVQAELPAEYDIIEFPLPEKGVLGAFNKRTKKIFVDSNISDDEKVFTLLHEFGHAHLEHSSDKTYRRRLVEMVFETDLEEMEANLFAALVIISKEKLHSLLINFFKKEDFDKDTLLKTISNIFHVSDFVAEFRLMMYLQYKV